MIAARACLSSAGSQFNPESRLFPVHPHHVARAHDGAAIDVDSGAFVDVVADAHVGAADDALAAAGLVAAHVVHIAFVVQVGRLATEKDVGRDLLALVHLVGDDVGHGVAAFGGRQAHIGQQVDQDKLRVFGGGGFVGHGVYFTNFNLTKYHPNFEPKHPHCVALRESKKKLQSSAASLIYQTHFLLSRPDHC